MLANLFNSVPLAWHILLGPTPLGVMSSSLGTQRRDGGKEWSGCGRG